MKTTKFRKTITRTSFKVLC